MVFTSDQILQVLLHILGIIGTAVGAWAVSARCKAIAERDRIKGEADTKVTKANADAQSQIKQSEAKLLQVKNQGDQLERMSGMLGKQIRINAQMAPLGSQPAAIEEKVLKRAAWVLRQQRTFQSYPSASPLPRRYVSGEAYRYLGRQYRLKVVQENVERVRLERGYLTVHVKDGKDTTHIALLIHNWYLHHAKKIFTERLKLCFPRVEVIGIPYPELAIRDMKLRWGSCSPKGLITLNIRLTQVPKDLIDYVILHELCHLKEPNHSPAFYRLLEQTLPDWEERRKKLNQFEVI